MIPYQDLADRLLAAHQIIATLSVMGIAAMIALWMLWDKYEEIVRYLKDDGQLVRMNRWKAKQQQKRNHVAYHLERGGTAPQCRDPKCKGLQ